MSTGGEYIHRALRAAGVDQAIGIPGRGTLPLDRAVREDGAMDYLLARHETSVPYLAWGYYRASGRPAATITVPGPGDTNAANGLRNATIDRIPIVHVVPEVPPDQRGTGFIHEIDPRTYDTVVKANVDVTVPREAPAAVDAGIERALRPPRGPVRIGMPYLDREIEGGDPELDPARGVAADDAGYERALDALADARRPAVYLGVGANRPPDGIEALTELLEMLDAPFVTSYTGKGAVPETDPRWAGTTGAQLPAGANEMLGAADVVLALGTAFSGPTTRGGQFPMGETLIHVDSDPASFARHYEADIAIVDDVPTASERLRTGLAERGFREGWPGAELGRRIREEYHAYVEEEGMFADRRPAPTPAVVRELDEVLPDEAIVVSDIAECRTWAMQLVEAAHPAGFVATGSWTSMGVGLPGAIGASLAAPDRPVVGLVGDGGLMQSIEELHTAAEAGLDLTVLVFNNGQLAMINTTPGLEDSHRFGWDSPDFLAIAVGLGWYAVGPETPGETAAALDEAIDTDGPTLLDVRVDPEEPSSMDAWAYDTELEFEAPLPR